MLTLFAARVDRKGAFLLFVTGSGSSHTSSDDVESDVDKRSLAFGFDLVFPFGFLVFFLFACALSTWASTNSEWIGSRSEARTYPLFRFFLGTLRVLRMMGASPRGTTRVYDRTCRSLAIRSARSSGLSSARISSFIAA
jgi:hypothetical protein